MPNDIIAALKEWRDAKMELHDYIIKTEWDVQMAEADRKKETFKDRWIRLAEAEWNLYTLAKELNG